MKGHSAARPAQSTALRIWGRHAFQGGVKPPHSTAPEALATNSAPFRWFRKHPDRWQHLAQPASADRLGVRWLATAFLCALTILLQWRHIPLDNVLAEVVSRAQNCALRQSRTHQMRAFTSLAITPIRRRARAGAARYKPQTRNRRLRYYSSRPMVRPDVLLCPPVIPQFEHQ